MAAETLAGAIPKLNSGGLLMTSGRQSSRSRKVSRSGNLNSWPEEYKSDHHSVEFFMANDSTDDLSGLSKMNQESCDSGIAVDALSVDTELGADPGGVDDGMRRSTSSGSGWSLAGMSPGGPSCPTSPTLPLVNGFHRLHYTGH